MGGRNITSIWTINLFLILSQLMVDGAHGITGARVIRLVEGEDSSDTESAIALTRSIMANHVLGSV